MNGYQSTSINEIIEKSSIAAGTFYLYFNDKEALYTYLLMQYRHSIRKTISEAIKPAQTRRDKEKLGIQAFLKYAWRDPLAYKIIWESMFVNKQLFQDYYESFAKDYMRQLDMSHSELNPNLNLETTAYMLMGISNFVGLQVLFRDTFTDIDLERITHQVMTLLDEGMFKKKDTNV
jgi:AcrR family transcriptional regulator